MMKIGETFDTDRQTRALAQRLGYAGLIPFAIGAGVVWAQPAQLSGAAIADITLWVLFYGAVILSFMGGAQWGSALRTGRFDRLMISVVPALVGWLAVVPSGIIPGFSPDMPVRFLILFCSFVGLMVSELIAREWDGWYAGLRIKLSIGTISMLFLTILGLVY